MGVSDKGLREVLRRHIEIMQREQLNTDDEQEQVGDVRDSGGKRGIVDLMLWRDIPQARQRVEKLVVELKRPSVAIGDAQLSQIERYALAVSGDVKYNKVDARWDFIIVGATLAPYVETKTQERNRPPGCTLDTGTVKVWAKTWGEVIGDAEQRLKFVQKALDYEATHDGGLQYLRDTYESFLPPMLADGAVAPAAGATTPSD